jgi:ABC-type dipeptide/oligopeptide/nickel transport system permease subunit
MVLSVLFLSLTLGAALAGLAIFQPRPFATLLRRLHELAGAVPALLLLMLWRMGDAQASLLGFVIVLSAPCAVEIARLLADTGQRLHPEMTTQGGPVRERWRRLLQNSVGQLRSQLATHAALVSSAAFGLDAALSFVDLGLSGAPSWGQIVGRAARAGNVAPASVALSLLGIFVTVACAHRLVAATRTTHPGEAASEPTPHAD